jgi:hypothetical protein
MPVDHVVPSGRPTDNQCPHTCSPCSRPHPISADSPRSRSRAASADAIAVATHPDGSRACQRGPVCPRVRGQNDARCDANVPGRGRARQFRRVALEGRGLRLGAPGRRCPGASAVPRKRIVRLTNEYSLVSTSATSRRVDAGRHTRRGTVSAGSTRRCRLSAICQQFVRERDEIGGYRTPQSTMSRRLKWCLSRANRHLPTVDQTARAGVQVLLRHERMFGRQPDGTTAAGLAGVLGSRELSRRSAAALARSRRGRSACEDLFPQDVGVAGVLGELTENL